MRVNDGTAPHMRVTPFVVDRPWAEERGYRLWAYPLDRYEMRAYLLARRSRRVGCRRAQTGAAKPRAHSVRRVRIAGVVAPLAVRASHP